MPALISTGFSGIITWLGVVPDRDVALSSQMRTSLAVGFGGAAGEAHGGLTRPSCSRVTAQYPRGTVIRNTRQLTVLSAEDLAATAEAMGLPTLDTALVGATMVIEGIPDFTHVPPSARLQGVGGATLVVDMLNRPCQLPARPIEDMHPGFGARYKSAAKGRRGVTAWVEREGTFALGERVTLHIPDQRPWAHAPKKRTR